MKFDPPSGSCWRYTKDKMEEAIADNRIWFGSDGTGVPRIKKFITEGKQGLTPETLLFSDDVGTNDSAKRELVSLFDGKAVFDTPKPVSLLRHLCKICNDGGEGIYMDFFSGTATTAHAVMQLNAEDGGKRKFIMVQLPEETDEKSEAYKAGYKNICEIGKERIRRAGKKILAENDKLKDVPFLETEEDISLFIDIAAHGKEAVEKTKAAFKRADISHDLDIGFRVLKCDSSNMTDVYYNPAEFEPSMFDTAVDNIKEDRTPEDLLFQVMLDLGVLLSSKIEETTIAGKKVFNVADGFLIACFDENVTEEVIMGIAKQKPYYFVMRDNSMADDSVATNFEQIFAAYSPETVRKVL